MAAQPVSRSGTVPLWFFGSFLAIAFAFFINISIDPSTHCASVGANVRESLSHGRHSSDDIGFTWITNMPRRFSRLGRRNQHQLISANLAPAAHVDVAQIDEVNGTIVLVLPAFALHLGLPSVNLHPAARP